MFARWPGKFTDGMIAYDTTSALDWVPLLVAAAGNDQNKDQLMSGAMLGDKEFKVHPGGYNLIPNLTGDAEAAS